MLVCFELSMPNNGSWNGKWSGEGKCYARVENLPSDVANRVISEGPYGYNFGDGWRARVSVRLVDAAEARKVRRASAGFCGYDWMIDSIKKHGAIKVDER